MKKELKYTLVSLGCLVVLVGVGLGIMYVVSPYKVKRWLGIASSYSDVFVDRLKGNLILVADMTALMCRNTMASILSSIATRASIIRRWGQSLTAIISSSPIITPVNPLSTEEESAISGSIPKPDICQVLEKG